MTGTASSPELITPRVRNPFFSLWLRPQKTIRDIAQSQPSRHVLIFAALGGLYSALIQGGEFLAKDPSSSTYILSLVIFLGPLFGVISLYLFAALMAWFGRLLGGQGSRRDLRAAIAWSQTPIVVALGFMLVGVAVYGIGALPFFAFAEAPG